MGGFYSVVQYHDFEVGAKALMSIGGVGKLSPNMVLLGFKRDWRTDMDGLEKYMSSLYNAFDMNFSVGILRVKKGLDYSHVSILSHAIPISHCFVQNYLKDLFSSCYHFILASCFGKGD